MAVGDGGVGVNRFITRLRIVKNPSSGELIFQYKDAVSFGGAGSTEHVAKDESDWKCVALEDGIND